VKQKRVKQLTLESELQSCSPGSSADEASKKRVRCGACQSCANTEDCNQCYICFEKLRTMDGCKRDGVRRKTCLMRECLKPILPLTASCSECGLDGWGDIPGPSILSTKCRDASSNLMECTICLQIVHPLCIGSKVSPKTAGIINEDLPNSWECPICMEKIKPVRQPKRQKSNDERKNSLENNAGSVGINGHGSLPSTDLNDKSDQNGSVKKTTFLSVSNDKPDFIGVTIKQEKPEIEDSKKQVRFIKNNSKIKYDDMILSL